VSGVRGRWAGILVVEQSVRWHKPRLQQRGEGASAWRGSDHDEFCECVHILFNLSIFTLLDNLLLIQTSHQVSGITISANRLSPVKSLKFMPWYCHRLASPCSGLFPIHNLLTTTKWLSLLIIQLMVLYLFLLSSPWVWCAGISSARRFWFLC